MTEETRIMNQAIKEITIKTGKYLTFSLNEEEYGIGI
jgi:purine-binding chemotaxis protein CheW